MKPSDIFRKALISFLTEKLTQSVIADSLGIQRPLMNDFIKGRRNFSEDRREKIAAFFGKTYLEMLNIGQSLISGEGKESRPDRDREITVQVHTKHEKDLLENQASDYRGISLYDSGCLTAWFDDAGFGLCDNPEREVIVYLPELKQRANHHLIAVRVEGDFMNPLVPEDAIVIIDRDDREFADNKIFAVCIEEGGTLMVAVRRVWKFEGARGGFLWSENSGNSPQLVTEREWPGLCIGRVVWMWRDFECF